MIKKIKKLCIATSLLLLATNAVADFMPAPYVGGGLGIVTNADSHFGYFRGLPLRVFAGYGGVINTKFYLAGELAATLVTGDLANSSYGLQSNQGYMLSVLPGFMLNDYTLGFVRVGAVRTQFKDPNEWVSGAQLGLGLATAVTQNVLVGRNLIFSSH